MYLSIIKNKFGEKEVVFFEHGKYLRPIMIMSVYELEYRIKQAKDEYDAVENNQEEE